MRKLAYLVTFGKTFFYQLAELSIESLLKTGFDGDIVVLSQHPYKFKGAETILLDRDFKHKYEPHMCRARLHEYIDMSKYDVVLYIDTDVIAIRDTTPILEDTMNNNCFSVFTAPTRLHKLWHYATMDKPQRDKFINSETPSICSGVYALPANQVEETFKLWLDIFENRISNPDLFVCDQNVLCEAIYTEQLKSNLLPNKWLFYPKYHKEEKGTELLIHHCAQSRYVLKYKYLEERLGKVTDDYQKTRTQK